MKKKPLYPLLFKPIIKEKLWGGEKLGSVLNKPVGNRKKIGESWEISGVEGNISEVINGELAGKNLVELINEYGGELIGDHVYNNYGTKFPLLIKFIDANKDLSIQVHPDDKLAKERHDSYGKTEMWYVVDAEDDATLISGFNQTVTKQEYLDAFHNGNLMDILNKEDVYKDDVFFLPAGRVHTIGKGLLIAEIQQSSDITYRIYDFDRTDDQGNKRELHVEQAVDAIDYTFYENYKTRYDKSSSEVTVGESNYFITKRLMIDGTQSRDYSTIDSCIILMILNGNGVLRYGEDEEHILAEGQTILLPNAIDRLNIHSDQSMKILEVAIP